MLSGVVETKIKSYLNKTHHGLISEWY